MPFSFSFAVGDLDLKKYYVRIDTNFRDVFHYETDESSNVYLRLHSYLIYD